MEDLRNLTFREIKMTENYYLAEYSTFHSGFCVRSRREKDKKIGCFVLQTDAEDYIAFKNSPPVGEDENER